MSKTILITGTSSGFGKDTAKTLVADGHRVFASMRDMNGRNAATAAELQASGIETLELDVTDNASVDSAMAHLDSLTGGKLDVLINNAGLANVGLAETFTPEQLREMFEVNVFGVQRMLRAVLPEMRKNGTGLVINIGSIVGRLTIPFFGLYGATKFAIEALTDTYRYEVSQFGVDIVLIQPGPFPTNLYTAPQASNDPDRVESYGDIAKLPASLNAVLGPYFANPDTPKPHVVADIVAKLVDTPAGHRPARIIAGDSFGADEVNEAVAPLQSKMVAVFDLSHLETLKTR